MTNIYVDMDGVQAVYGFGDSVEEMAVPGYFLNRPAQENMIRVMKMLDQDPRFRVIVLSAVFSAEHNIRDKKAWLEAQGLGGIETCFVPLGENKADRTDKNEVNILIDDFSKNLFRWESSGDRYYGIKFINGGNGTRGSWHAAGGFSVSSTMPADRLYLAISGIASAVSEYSQNAV